MPPLRRVKITYRTKDHAPVLYLTQEGGFWKKCGLDVNLELNPITGEVEKALSEGRTDIISGTHIRPYVAKKKGEGPGYTSFAQFYNWLDQKLVAKSEIRKPEEIAGKRFATGALRDHGELNTWLTLLEMNLDPSDNEIKLLPISENSGEKLDAVVSKKADATFVTAPYDLIAKSSGLNVFDVPRIPMIHKVTLNTSWKFAQENGDILRAVLRGMVDAIAFMRSRRENAIRIMMGGSVSHVMGLRKERDVFEQLYDKVLKEIEFVPYPLPAAIQNVFREALRDNPEIADVNPISIWDTHFVRELEEEGVFKRST